MKLEHCHSLECKQHIDALSEALAVADEGRNYANELLTAMTKERDELSAKVTAWEEKAATQCLSDEEIHECIAHADEQYDLHPIETDWAFNLAREIEKRLAGKES